MSRSYLLHGRRHAVQGSDPIPGIGSAAAANLSFFGSPLSMAASAEDTIGWSAFSTTDGNVFGTNTLGLSSGITNTAGDTTLILQKPGLYMAIGETRWDTGSANIIGFVDMLLAGLTGGSGDTTTEALTTTDFAGTPLALFPSSLQAAWVDEGAQNGLRLVVQNRDAGTHVVTEASLSCFFWPGSASLASVF